MKVLLFLLRAGLIASPVQQIDAQRHSRTYITRGPESKFKRDPKVRAVFLHSKGYKRTPKGYEVDHFVPLWADGKDQVSSMQLPTKEQHKRKTEQEEKNWKNKPWLKKK